MTGREILIYLSIKYEGEWDKIVQAVRNKEDFSTDEAQSAIAKVKSNVVTIIDGDYPQCLKEGIKPPLVIYYYGDLDLIKDRRRCITYVGSRNASPYGVMMAHKIVAGLVREGFVVISGLAKGIDRAATEATLEGSGKAVCILGSGIENCYPFENRDLYRRLKTEGLLISEYPLECEAKKEHFPARNRLLAAAAQCVVVGEASQKSGTLITVGHALSLNRDVGCVPYEADKNSACNALIKEGATMIESADDVFFLINYQPKAVSKQA